MTPLPLDAVALARRLAAAFEGAGAPAERVALLAEVDALLAEHQDVVYAVCHRLVGNPEQAMELAQETLLTAYQRLTTFRGEAAFRSWLLQIARYHCLNAIRKRGELLSEDGVIEAVDPASSVLAGLRRQEREDLLRAAMETLTAEEQEVVYLRYVENLPLDRIDTLLGSAMASGARGVLQRCRRKLGKEIRARLEVLGHGSSFVRGTVE